MVSSLACECLLHGGVIHNPTQWEKGQSAGKLLGKKFPSCLSASAHPCKGVTPGTVAAILWPWKQGKMKSIWIFQDAVKPMKEPSLGHP